jgi:arabinosyltransferase C
MFSVSGGFSAYYNALGANIPNDYWLEWAQHWLSETTNALIFLRVPALVCLLATWVLCRWILARLLGPVRGRADVTIWALTSVFLVGALAWGMTLRPEPVTALLTTSSRSRGDRRTVVRDCAPRRNRSVGADRCCRT